MSITRLYNRKRRRERRKREGLCTSCGSQMDRIGSYCKDCTAKHREIKKRKKRLWKRLPRNKEKILCQDDSKVEQ